MASFQTRRRITRMNRWLDGVRFVVLMAAPLLGLAWLWNGYLRYYDAWAEEYAWTHQDFSLRMTYGVVVGPVRPRDWVAPHEDGIPLGIPMAATTAFVLVWAAWSVRVRVARRRRSPGAYFCRYLGGRRRRRMARTRRRRRFVAIAGALTMVAALLHEGAPYVAFVVLPRFAIPRPTIRAIGWGPAAFDAWLKRKLSIGRGDRITPGGALDHALATALRCDSRRVWESAVEQVFIEGLAGERSAAAALDLAEQTDLSIRLRIFEALSHGDFPSAVELWRDHFQQIDRILGQTGEDPRLVIQCFPLWKGSLSLSGRARVRQALRGYPDTLDTRIRQSYLDVIEEQSQVLPYDTAVELGVVPQDPRETMPGRQPKLAAVSAIVAYQRGDGSQWRHGTAQENAWRRAVAEDTRIAELLFYAITRGDYSESLLRYLASQASGLAEPQRDLYFLGLSAWFAGEGRAEWNDARAQAILKELVADQTGLDGRAYYLVQQVRHDETWRDRPALPEAVGQNWFAGEPVRPGETVGAWLKRWISGRGRDLPTNGDPC